LWIEEVIVEHALLAWLGDEAWPFLAGNEDEGVAGFEGAEDADESAFDALLTDEAFGPLIFLEGAGAIEIGAARLACVSLSMLNKPFGLFLSDVVDEVATAHLEHPIDEAFEFGRSRQGQMPFEDH
jgi:hypothetical protein